MQVHCPVCKKPIEVHGLDRQAHLRFCSRRCSLVDLDRWFEGDYRISTPLPLSDDPLGPAPAPPMDES